ncbi:MXAN_6230/SCO0854 family RING domain-containing protein [Micromonospora eburnea]|uniref:RING finger family protein 4 n=1 Tax=Micromonospora eburnea TaxID=227316 RepID=A0A1C6V3K3_9ACTN|nr:MXAN_6230/SCO0854 family RING domain-containing protein [Micromonospora eburnea]SCL60717.1 RING finger family protein 4 [Micromonospora eburnea]
MTRLTAPTTTSGVHPVAVALARRAGLVATGLLHGGRKVRRPGRRPAGTAEGVTALEADVLALGWLIGPRLRAALAALPAERLASVGHGLLTTLETAVGAHAPHVPLFKDFPRRVPADTQELYVRRMFALLLQRPEQPCVLCGRVRTVHPVSPCAHLTCVACWDEGYTACPICHRRITDGPFLPVVAPPSGGRTLALPRRAELLELADDVDRAVHQALAALLARRTPLSPTDQRDLLALVDHAGPAEPTWLPDEVPVRETRALLLDRLLAGPVEPAPTAALLDRYVTTATDVLRLLAVRDGGDPGLVESPKRRGSLPRPLRRALLARLDALGLPALLADLPRHRDRWLAAAENLHPFEQPARHPEAATAFAVLRRTTVTPDSRLGRVVAEVVAAYAPLIRPVAGRLHAASPAARVEAALASGDVDTAVELLAHRPGELLRRAVALAARGGAPERLCAAVAAAARTGSPGVLIAALGAVRAATWPAGTRLFFPRGGRARLWAEPDRRPRLPAVVGGELEDLLVTELRERAARLPRVDVALLDAALADLMAPFAERTASDALVRLPRGSARPLPDGRRVRLFLHWTEPAGTRVDLDLSVAMIADDGGFVGWCDYTRLRFGDTAAVHSGDLTSAPAPLGASEFVDLDIPALTRRGIRYVAMVVFSYNDVPFEEMTDAFAGFMGDPGNGAPFEPKAVEQRFDLTGRVKIATPLVVDLRSRALRWIDATMTGTGGEHSVARYSRTLARLTVAADEHFAAGRRVSLWELACWHAAGRADTVLVRGRDGGLTGYRRADGESPAAFAGRLTARGPADEVPDGIAEPRFAALVRGDVALPAGAQAYALHRAELDPERVTLLGAADLLADLAPRR